jgi:hypothetical protein
VAPSPGLTRLNLPASWLGSLAETPTRTSSLESCVGDVRFFGSSHVACTALFHASGRRRRVLVRSDQNRRWENCGSPKDQSYGGLNVDVSVAYGQWFQRTVENIVNRA